MAKKEIRLTIEQPVSNEKLDDRYSLVVDLKDGGIVTFLHDEYDTYFWDGKEQLLVIWKDHHWVGCYRLQEIAGFRLMKERLIVKEPFGF